MNEPKFTPGPWMVLHEGSSEVSVLSNEGGICILNLDPRPKEEVKKHLANAHLIAAAPELYDALAEAAAGKCWSCAGVNVYTVLDDGCPKGHDGDCYVAKWIELLRKVRDGA